MTPMRPLPLEDSAADLLVACHERIRRACHALETIAAHPDDPRVPASIPALVRYLEEALLKHAADEDESLTPRLLRHDPSLAAVLDRLANDHAAFERALPEVCGLLRTMPAPGGEPIPVAHLAPLAQLAAHLRAHLELEEAEWFPHLPALPPADLTAIRAEMAGRRAPPG